MDSCLGGQNLVKIDKIVKSQNVDLFDLNPKPKMLIFFT